MASPRFAPFPKDEYDSRTRKAQALMEKRGFDALLLTSKENVVYFTGLQTIGWDSKHRPLGAIVPKDGDPTLVIPESLAVVAQETCWLDDVRLWGGIRQAGAPKDAVAGICKAMRDLGCDGGTVGMELGYGQRIGMSQLDFDELRSALLGLRPADASDLLWELRMVKSPREIEVMRELCLATCEAYRRTFESARENMTERELAGVLFAEMSRLTGYRPGFIGIRSGPVKYPMVNVPPFDKPIQRGDIVLVDAGATYRDYWSDTMRMMCVGEPTAEQRRFFEAEYEAVTAGVAAMQPGATADDVCRACLDALKRKGFGPQVMALERVGHGLGLDMHEPPSMALNSPKVLEPGMVLTCEPIFSDTPDYKIGNFGLEEIVLITQTGHEVLTPFPKDLWIVTR